MNISSFLLYLLSVWLMVYAVLLGIYFITGFFIEKSTVNLISLKIQKDKVTSRQDKIIDIRQSIISLITISFFLGLGYTLRHYGFSLFKVNTASLIMYLLYFILSLVLFDTWFYWMHRLLHVQPLFKYVHAWHHRSRFPSTWANNSDSILDNLFLQSYWLIAFLILPFPASVLFAHKIFDQITGMMGHSGYEISGTLPLKYKFLVAVLHHDQHHSAVKYNFATHFSWWDRITGTLHPDYDTKNKMLTR
ncbi:sterol desaturase family protein [Legionella sp. PATHC038]|uniref:sterol desaturase family protein n=1 Tax=Legionella sheltonii TaxID=2992041 RepID=UPI002244B013|nr:sterol desaturase family protein [Legionella sp. PATHC038]MCW8399467.1 sterol desaturase family protein [Legionella sp. PATHC038]